MKVSAGTDIGKMRSSNQDSYAFGDLPDGGIWAVVCDGMGGHAGGNVASEIAVSVMSEFIKSNYREAMSASSVRNMLEAAVESANIGIYDRSIEDEELNGMGTTVVATVCDKSGKAQIVHVGDSRCCLVSGGKLSRITKDHSYVQELVDAGYITEEEAEHHPQKNIITRALGTEEKVYTDFSEAEIGMGDRLLLCTDGLTNLVSENEVTDCMSAEDIADCAEKLISLANEHGGTDNITAVVIAG